MGASDRYERLKRITTLRRELDTAALARLIAHQAEIRSEAETWHRAACYAPDPARDELAAVAAWHGHAALRLAATRTELDRLAPEVEKAHARLSRSFGQDQALSKLEERARKRTAGSAGRVTGPGGRYR